MFLDFTKTLTLDLYGTLFNEAFRTLHDYNSAWDILIYIVFDIVDLDLRCGRNLNCRFALTVLAWYSLNVVWLLHAFKRSWTIYFEWLWVYLSDINNTLPVLHFSVLLHVAFVVFFSTQTSEDPRQCRTVQGWESGPAWWWMMTSESACSHSNVSQLLAFIRVRWWISRDLQSCNQIVGWYMRHTRLMSLTRRDWEDAFITAGNIRSCRGMTFRS